MGAAANDPMTPETKSRLLHMTDEAERLAGHAVENLIVQRRRALVGLAPQDEYLLNVIELALLAWHEISALSSDTVRYEGTFRANLYARLLVLSMYESAKRLKGLLGPDFLQAARSVVPEGPTEGELRRVHSDMSRFFKSCRTRFGDVRDGIVGHRDPDPNVRLALLLRTDSESALQMAEQMLLIFDTLGPFIAAYTAGASKRLGWE